MTVTSGSATWARCLPGAPGCLPCFPAAARRSAREGAGGFANSSAEGGVEALRGLRPRRSCRSATWRFRRAISAACASTRAASCSYVGDSGEGSRVGIPHGTRVDGAGGGRGVRRPEQLRTEQPSPAHRPPRLRLPFGTGGGGARDAHLWSDRPRPTPRAYGYSPTSGSIGPDMRRPARRQSRLVTVAVATSKTQPTPEAVTATMFAYEVPMRRNKLSAASRPTPLNNHCLGSFLHLRSIANRY